MNLSAGDKPLQLNLHSIRVPEGLHFLLERAISVTTEKNDLPFLGYSIELSLQLVSKWTSRLLIFQL